MSTLKSEEFSKNAWIQQDADLFNLIRKFETLPDKLDRHLNEHEALLEEKESKMNQIYNGICRYFGLEKDESDDPFVRIEKEEKFLQEKIASLKEEIEKLGPLKHELKLKGEAKREELAKIKELAESLEKNQDTQYKSKFKVFSRLLNVSYKTDTNCKATSASFKNKDNDVVKMIRCEDMSKTKEEKVTEFWKTLEVIRKEHHKASHGREKKLEHGQYKEESHYQNGSKRKHHMEHDDSHYSWGGGISGYRDGYSGYGGPHGWSSPIYSKSGHYHIQRCLRPNHGMDDCGWEGFAFNN